MKTRRITIGLCLIFPWIAHSEYSINLMWINTRLNPDQNYIFPANSENELDDKFLSHIQSWEIATGQNGHINLWYDGLFTSSEAVKATKRALEKKSNMNPQWAMVHFRDARELLEVKENPKVFSADIPIYFRVDLIRAIAAFQTLIQEEKNHFFVYADLDMKPLAQEQLFDVKTQKKLHDFGIVMARGGNLGFENGFQIIGNQKPNLLKALKRAVIDINIERANRILRGNSWASHAVGDVEPLQQVVYDSYPSMFHYFYHLQGWGKVPSLALQDLSLHLGLHRIKIVDFQATSGAILIDKIHYNIYGKEERVQKLRIPTKTVDLPPSRFGGSPKKYDPDKITKKNFTSKLLESLNGSKKFDRRLIYLAARNNYTEAIEKISEKLSPSELVDAFSGDLESYKYSDEKSPLRAALVEGNSEVIRIIMKKLSIHAYLFARMVEALQKSSDKDKMTLSYEIARNGPILGLNAFFNFPRETLFEIIKKEAIAGRFVKVKWIGENYPGALKDGNALSLALATKDMYAPELIEWLVSIDSDILKRKDQHGYTFAEILSWDANWNMLDWLVGTYPEVLSEKGQDGTILDIVKQRKDCPKYLLEKLELINLK